MQTIERAIGNGHPVLIENVGEIFDMSLQSLLERNIVRCKAAGNVSASSVIHLSGGTIEYNDRFRLYMTTVLSSPNFMPEIVSKVTFLNFTMNDRGLECQMLATIIAEERVDLQDKKEKLIVETAKNRDLLYKLESNIFDVLSASEGNILEDENAINILSTSKTMSEDIQSKQMTNATSEAEIDAERHRYMPLAEYSALLYFCLVRLADINAMYQFSLQWFHRHFVKHLRQTSTSNAIEERLANLRKSFTAYLYAVVYPTLHARDRLVFSFMICIDVMRTLHIINDDQLKFILSQHDRSEGEEPAAGPENVSWIDRNSWNLLDAAAKLPKYFFRQRLCDCGRLKFRFFLFRFSVCQVSAQMSKTTRVNGKHSTHQSNRINCVCPNRIKPLIH